MDIDPWEDWGHVPLLCEVEGTPCVLSSYFLGVEIKMVVTRCHILELKCTIVDFDWGGHTSKRRQGREKGLGGWGDSIRPRSGPPSFYCRSTPLLQSMNEWLKRQCTAHSTSSHTRFSQAVHTIERVPCGKVCARIIMAPIGRRPARYGAFAWSVSRHGLVYIRCSQNIGLGGLFSVNSRSGQR